MLAAADARAELSSADREHLSRFEAWFAAERVLAPVLGAEGLLARAIERTGYTAHVLSLPGGSRRQANVRKLMRLAREWEAQAGSDLRGFLELWRPRARDRP